MLVIVLNFTEESVHNYNKYGKSQLIIILIIMFIIFFQITLTNQVLFQGRWKSVTVGGAERSDYIMTS